MARNRTRKVRRNRTRRGGASVAGQMSCDEAKSIVANNSITGFKKIKATARARECNSPGAQSSSFNKVNIAGFTWGTRGSKSTLMPKYNSSGAETRAFSGGAAMTCEEASALNLESNSVSSMKKAMAKAKMRECNSSGQIKKNAAVAPTKAWYNNRTRVAETGYGFCNTGITNNGKRCKNNAEESKRAKSYEKFTNQSTHNFENAVMSKV